MVHGHHPHHHSHHHHHHQTSDGSTRNIGIAFWLNFLFAIVELIGGFWTNSYAIMSDALHDFGDAISLGIGYFLQKKSAAGPTENFSYGLRRLSLSSAFLSGLVISSGAVFIIIESVKSFTKPHEPNGLGMMGLAVFGVLVNGVAALRLSQGHTQNEKMLKWHLIEDVLGWIAVLVGSLCIWLFNWTWLDPFMAAGIGIFILYNVFKGLGETIGLFLQGNPNPQGLREWREDISKISNVAEIHDVHFWSLDGTRHILSLHVVLKDLTHQETDKLEIRKLSEKLGDCHVTIEIESTSEHCHNDCEHVHG
jgi:cobalt-zinc-cadmium efflux system protein